MPIIPRQPGYRLPRKSKSLHILRASVVKQPTKGWSHRQLHRGAVPKAGHHEAPKLYEGDWYINVNIKHARPSLKANFSFVIGYSFRNNH